MTYLKIFILKLLEQEAMLKSELHNMERVQKREGVDMTYLKNVILKLLETGEVDALLPKNVGPSGVTIVIIKKDLIGNDGIYMCGLAYEDLLDQGGSVEVEKKNKKKAEILYNAYNGSIGFYRFPGEKSVRSLMNVPFTLEKSGLEIEFIKEAAMENMVQLKWHKSVGVCVLLYTMLCFWLALRNRLLS
ncbi:hypothetical protein CMV_014904 [Castanea mollissima]|uniref:Uncharacterized protein n=1 Tax=Castanea mollissima TaxID=60419 RepID=A0A8J4QWE2_9ROSI|nr:hypothetical protein CMV_014904 [Castanea mollissima]